MPDYELLQKTLDPELEYWRFLPDTDYAYVVGVDEGRRIQVYSLKCGMIRQLNQDKRRRGYYVRLTLDGKRTWRSVKQLYLATFPNRGSKIPTNFREIPEPKKRLASEYEVEQALEEGEDWGYARAECRLLELDEYVVTTEGRVLNLKHGEVTEASQTIDDNGARVRLYYEGKMERPYVHTLMRDVFGDSRGTDPRVSAGHFWKRERKVSDIDYHAHLSIYTNGLEKDWFGERAVFVERYGEEAVRQAEAKKPQFAGPTGY